MPYQKAIDIFGKESQINMMIEESAELTLALQHYRRGRVTDKAVIEEIVDNEIMLEQMKLIFIDKNEGLYEYYKHNKLSRLERRIHDHKSNES